MLIHTVFFKVKDDVSAEQTQALAEGAKMLGNIPGVNELYIGSPAATEPRPVIKTDYDVSLTVIFDSLAEQNVYQTHQIHQDFIAGFKDLWASVIVYDAD